MTCLIPNDWPVQITDEDPENGNEAEYELDGLKHLKVKERKDARLNVFVCFLINLIVQVLMSFVDIAVSDSEMLETLDINTTEANRANNLYKSMTDLYAPLALALMSATSYRVTVAIGSLLISAAFVNISFLYPEGTVSWYWQIWLCGPAAVGVSCLRMGALIPILEYFKRDRVKALVITRVGTVIGAAATIGIMFAENLSWKILLRINAGVCVPCFAIAFILKDIVITEKLKSENEKRKEENEKKKEENGKKKEENEKKKKEENEENKEENEENKEENDDGNECCESNRCCQFIKNTFSIPVLKDRAFWVMVIVFFFFGFGTTLPTSSFPTLSEELQEQLSPPVDSFYEVLSANIGNLIGLILTYLLQSLSCVKSYRERKQKMGFVFSIISLAGYIMAILSIITSDDYIYYIVYIFVLTIFEVLTENFRDDSMATAFGRFTIRLTQGFLRLSIGSAGVSAAGIQSGIEDGWKFKFRLGGGFFLFSGSISVLVLICNLISRRKSTEQKSENKSESECCSIFCCSNSSADNNQQEEICCSFLCCNSCESDKEEANERTPCFTCLFPSCCKKKQSRSQSESDKNTPTPGTNCCNLISSSTCFRKKKSTSQSLPEIDKSESAKGTNCCKGFSLPCFQTKRPTSEPKLENNKNKDDIKINCCKTFPISCFETQSETNKGETDTSVKCFEGFSLSCSNRKRQSSHSEIKTNKSESNTDIKCCKGFPPSCFQKKQHELEYDSNDDDDDDDDVKRSDSNVTLEQDKSSCKGSILQNFQPLQCFSRNKSRPEEISSDDNTLVGGSNVKSKSQEFDGKTTSCKMIQFSNCLKLPSMHCSSSKPSSTEMVSNTIQPTISQNNTPGPELDTKIEDKKSTCKRFPSCLLPFKGKSLPSNQPNSDTASAENNRPDEVSTIRDKTEADVTSCKGVRCFKFPNKLCKSEKVSESNLAIQNNSNQDETNTKEPNMKSEQIEPSCKKIIFPFAGMKCFSQNKSSSEMGSSENIAAHSTSEIDFDSKGPEPDMTSKKNVNARKGFSFSKCFHFPNKQCLSSNESNSDMETSEILPDLQPPKQSDNESKQFSHGGSASSSLAENIQNTINSEVSVKQQLVNIFSCKCLSTANRVSPKSSQGLIIHPDQYKRQENFSGSSVGSGKDLNSPISDIEKKLNKDNKQIATSTEEVSKNKSDSVEIPPNGNKNDLENFTGSSGGSDKDLESPFSEKGKKPNKDNKIIAPSTEKVPKDKRDTVEDDDNDKAFTPGPLNIPDSTEDQSKHSQPKNQPKSDGTPDPKIYPSLKRLENGEKDKRNKGEKKRKYTIESSEDSEEEFLNCPKLEKALAPPLKSSRKKRLKYELKRIKTAKK